MKWRPIYALVARELKAFFRDKATLFWAIAWPLIWLFMVAYVFMPMGSGEINALKVGVVVEDNTTGYFNSTVFLRVLENATYKDSKLFQVELYEDRESLTQALKRGELDAGIIVPPGFFKNITFSQAEVEVLVGGASPQQSSIIYATLSIFFSEMSRYIALAKVNATLKYMSFYMPSNPPWWSNVSKLVGAKNTSFIQFLGEYYLGIADPLKTVFREVKPEAVENRSRLLGWWTIGAVGMMLLYSGFSIGASLVVSEKESGALRRMLATPLTEGELLAGKILGQLASLLASSIIAILVGVYVLGAQMAWSITSVEHLVGGAMLIVGALLSIGIGVLLSLAARTSRGAANIGTALGLLLAFTAGIWFPREWMPPVFRLLADYFPVTWSLDAMRQLLVYGKSLGEVSSLVLGSLIALAVILWLDILVYKKMLRKYLEE